MKDQRTYEINKISFSCFTDKIYIQNNEYDGLALGYQSNSNLNNYFKKSFFVKHIVFIFSLISAAFLSSILNLKNTKNLKKDR